MTFVSVLQARMEHDEQDLFAEMSERALRMLSGQARRRRN